MIYAVNRDMGERFELIETWERPEWASRCHVTDRYPCNADAPPMLPVAFATKKLLTGANGGKEDVAASQPESPLSAQC